MRRRRILVAIAGLFVLISPLASKGEAAELRYVGCVTGDRQLGPRGNGACEQIPTATFGATHSGLALPLSLDIQGDSRTLYVAATLDSALTRFSLAPRSGRAEFAGCVTGDIAAGPTGSGACEQIPTARERWAPSGLTEPTDLVTGDDDLYVRAALGNDLAHFTTSTDGAASYQGCTTDDPDVGPPTGPCDALIDDWDSRPLYGAVDLLLSPDEESLYVITDFTTVTHLARSIDGELSFRSCVTGRDPTPDGACEEIPSGGFAHGLFSGLGALLGGTVSPDGRSIYTASRYRGVAHLRRDPETGTLSYRGCISGESSDGPRGSGICRLVPEATVGATGSGLDHVTAVVVSPDGRWLYAADAAGAIASFRRNMTTGRISFERCVTGDRKLGPGGSGACRLMPTATRDGSRSGLGGARALKISPSGRGLFVTSSKGDAVTRFERRPAGRLRFSGCVTGDKLLGAKGSGACRTIPSATRGGEGSGIDRLREIAIDRRSIYALSGGDQAVAQFRLSESRFAGRSQR